MLEFLEIKNDAEYNPLLISKNAPFTQGLIYGKWQKMIGRKVRRFEIIWKTEDIGFFQVIKYPLPFSQSFLYIPHGPVLKETILSTSDVDSNYRHRMSIVEIFCDKLSEIGKKENAIFVRFDFFLFGSNLSIGREGGVDLSKYFEKVPSYAYRSSYFQPKFEWMINLSKTDDELFKDMHPKARYSINLAQRKGVGIEIVNRDFELYFDEFYKLLRETAERNKFNLHPKNYYQNIFETLTADNAFLTVAKYQDEILSVNLILIFGGTAYFLFGGSSGEHKNFMFSHLAQWETIKEAKKRRMAVYNLGGVQENGESYKNYKGVSVFKKRFGGEFLKYSDSYDLILKPLWYKLYNLRKWVLNLKSKN